MGAILDLVRVLYEPRAAYQRIAQKPRLLAPFVALALALFAVGVLRLPFDRAATAAMMARLPSEHLAGGDTAGSYVAVALLHATIGLAVYVAFTAVVLWVALLLSGTQCAFRTLLVVATYAGVVRAVMAVAALAVLAIRGIDSITSSSDLTPSFGLDLLLPADSAFGPRLTAALADLNAFSFWGVFLVGLGVKITLRLRRSWSFVAAVLVLLLTVAYHVVAVPRPGGVSPSFIQSVEN